MQSGYCMQYPFWMYSPLAERCTLGAVGPPRTDVDPSRLQRLTKVADIHMPSSILTRFAVHTVPVLTGHLDHYAVRRHAPLSTSAGR
ncbi:hypothetical protein GCM10011579_078330 [Streptomyces albiflavescens]|uniref:Uncharacterized protein n=1 Tax=Streptomyces albiflavescens TaxID=1623582 RepID=A0A917YBF7_9ACTN|nr:hypothetical protein GCM10011579_078330 [Streptomyces albiflavescens]